MKNYGILLYAYTYPTEFILTDQNIIGFAWLQITSTAAACFHSQFE